MTQLKYIFLVTLLFALTASTLFSAELGFNRHYSNHMVLQREKPVLIRGAADKGAEVTIAFAGQTKKAKADETGQWSVTLDPMEANSKGAELTATANGKTVKLEDVLVGDVFLFARQTTIDISLGRNEAGKAAAVDVPSARVITIQTKPSYEPLQDLAKEATTGWSKLDKAAALKMTASTFYMTRELSKTTDVPIGIIDLNLGRHFPIAWMSMPALLETKTVFDGVGIVDRMIEIIEEIKSRGPDHPKETRRGYPRPPMKEDPRHPAVGYNAVLHPMRGLALKGLLLQLGNDYPYFIYNQLWRDGKMGDVWCRGQAYEDCYHIRKWGGYLKPYTIPRLPKEWRKVFGDDKLPVGLITPPGSDLETLAIQHYNVRELLRKTAEKESGVHLIQPSVAHVPFSAQPSDEKLLGTRCVAWLSGAVYQKEGAIPTGPLFDHISANGSEAQVFFKPETSKGLKAAPGALDHFEVAGLDLEYAPAKATLDGETIRLTNETVGKVFHVRYNWEGKPDQGLVNASGLPAVPFKTDDQEYPKRINHPPEPIPEKLTTPITEWKTDGPVIYKGDMNTGSEGGRCLGPTGLLVTEFGPNLFVNNAYIGSPADGKIFHGDWLYAVNGTPFTTEGGYRAILLQVAEAINEAETEEKKGLITFDVLRNGKKMSVELELEVLGSHSMTSPYNCDKTDRIVAKAEALLANFGGRVLGMKGGKVTGYDPHFGCADIMFLLAAGSPEYQGLVRRYVYGRLSRVDLEEPIDWVKGSVDPWRTSADMLLVAEYYLATGDRYVLPYLRWLCDGMSSIQIRAPEDKGPWPKVAPGSTGGWRHNFYGSSTYGTMPAIGVPASLGYHLAKEAGVKYSPIGYERAVDWFLHNGAKVAMLGYGFSAKPVTHGNNIDPEKLFKGKLWPGNGAQGGAAILFDLRGNGPVARVNSFQATHAWNSTWSAHGGNFWANLYTPLGARVHGKKSFMFFMKKNRNYQTLHRMHNGIRQEGRVFGVGQYLAYVVPRARLRILGAHPSVFAPNPPEVLSPALEAYWARDYAGCEKAVRLILDKGDLHGLDAKKAEQLYNAAVLIQKSIALDLAKMKRLIDENKPYEASLEIGQLKAVLPEGHAELAALEKQLSDPALNEAIANDKKRLEAFRSSLVLRLPDVKEDAEDESTQWESLVAPNANKWRMKILESLENAPEGWVEPDFDDTDWLELSMPLSWQENHTSILRTTFDLEDPTSVQELQLRQYAYHCRAIQMYLNGKLIVKMTNSGGGGHATVPLNDHALKLLRKGKNTLAVTYKHNMRWGRYFAGKESVYARGIHLNLEMKRSQTP